MNKSSHISYRIFTAIALVALLLLAACSGTRHVPHGALLLDKVKIRVDSGHKTLAKENLTSYLRQTPNHKMLWSAKFRLGIYDMSGRDSTKWCNKWLRKMGEPPVIFSQPLTDAGAAQLQKLLVNRGYLGATVDVDTISNPKKRKMQVTYNVHPGEAHIISSVDMQIADSTVADALLGSPTLSLMQTGDPLDRSKLDLQRDLIVHELRNLGYYSFTKESIRFTADTTAGSRDVALTMIIDAEADPAHAAGSDAYRNPNTKYLVRKVFCITDYNAAEIPDLRDYRATDTVTKGNVTILYGNSKYLRPSVIDENSFIRHGELYSERDIDRTYKAFSRLEILKFVNVRFLPAGTLGPETAMLDAYILLTPGKSQSLQAELEGTNSEGDLGLAVALAYSHRNLGKGSETFTAKLRGAYESISGNLDGLLHNRYMEYSLDLGLQFPKFKAPFLREKFKRNVNASTELHLSMNYQERPEYTRIISTAGWSYRWTERNTRNRHTFTPIDINYVYLPESTNDFIDQIAPDNPLLRYSYEDHFIMRLGYSFYHTNKKQLPPWQRHMQRNIYTIRVNAETAGNLLLAISSIFGHRPDFRRDPYKVFGIRYSQYVKVDADYALTHVFDHRQSIAFHAGLGVAYPYGNSTILPFEKRFYGGGANGVRGWSVRTLGPGMFPGSNELTDFMNQCGDIRLILSAEYRAKLFWIVEGALFVDVGNIWTIKNYANQEGGLFKFNSFYKQLAGAYGVGIRLDFNYFLIRFDLGMKAHNPAINQEPWPLIHPNWKRDSAFHFSIGYPF